MNQIGRYEIEHEVGRGAMGAVYLGFDPLLKRRIAVKQVLPGAASADQPWDVLLKRLSREAQAAASLSHPNIMSVYDIVAEAEMFAVVMEFIEGKTLAEEVPPGTSTTPEFAIRVLKDCAAALDHAHSRGVVHRDVKPANIMLDAPGAVKITDFGIAKFINSTTELTRGFAVGTLEYMSPEQLNGHAVDGRSDQFSLAAVAYRLLTGARIYDADSLGVWCALLMTQRPVAASGRNSVLPSEVDAVLDRAMAMKPEKRYATCTEFVSALEAVVGQPSTIRPVTNSGFNPASITRAQPTGGRWKIGVFVAGLAGVLLAGVILFLKRPESKPPLPSPTSLTAPPRVAKVAKEEPQPALVADVTPEVAAKAPAVVKQRPAAKPAAAKAVAEPASTAETEKDRLNDPELQKDREQLVKLLTFKKTFHAHGGEGSHNYEAAFRDPCVLAITVDLVNRKERTIIRVPLRQVDPGSVIQVASTGPWTVNLPGVRLRGGPFEFEHLALATGATAAPSASFALEIIRTSEPAEVMRILNELIAACHQ